MENQDRYCDQELATALTSGKLTYLSTMRRSIELQFRWFLKSEIASSGKNYLFIGMNPSTATEFSASVPPGDATTRTVLNELKKKELFTAPAKSVTLLNLIPLVCTDSAEVPGIWSLVSVEDKRRIRDVTATLVETFADESDIIIPMWGSQASWKEDQRTTVSSILRCARNAENKVFAFHNPQKEMPTPNHCSFGNWRKEDVQFDKFYEALKY